VYVLPGVASSCTNAAIGRTTNQDVRAIPVHEGDLGWILDKELHDAIRLLQEGCNLRHRDIDAERLTVNGKMDLLMIDASDVSREEEDQAAELPILNRNDVVFSHHGAALDKDLLFAKGLISAGKGANGKVCQESGEWANSGNGHCLMVLRFYFLSLVIDRGNRPFNFFDSMVCT
jgi:hypothetical protein